MNTDFLLYYSASDKLTWNRPFPPMTLNTLTSFTVTSNQKRVAGIGWETLLIQTGTGPI